VCTSRSAPVARWFVPHHAPGPLGAHRHLIGLRQATATIARCPDRFPALVALGEHVWLDNWLDNRAVRFTAGLDVLVAGLEHPRRSPPSVAAQQAVDR
jgi:hypothetical protein